jgi:hypothetical protein
VIALSYAPGAANMDNTLTPLWFMIKLFLLVEDVVMQLKTFSYIRFT